MPLPGLNPLEKAPPPGTQKVAASMAQAARLHQRITDLERKIDAMATRGSQWTPFTPTFISPWAAYPNAAYQPCYRIEGQTVYLTGLIQPASATAAGANIMTLPDYLRPAPAVPNLGGVGAFFFSLGIQAGTGCDVYVYPHDHPTLAGRIVCIPAYPAGNYISLSGIFFRRRPDM